MRPALIATLIILVPLCPAADQPVVPTTPVTGFHLLKTVVLGGDGGWDLLTMDPAARRLYLSRGDHVQVVDPDTGAPVGQVPGNGVHGIAVDAKAGRGFSTNGRDDTVTIFDLATLKVLGTAKTGSKPDAIIYDPASDRVFACNNGGTTITAIAAADGAVVATIDVGGQPELPAVDGKGRLYVNLEDKSQVTAVDAATLKVTATWPLAPGEGPTGLAVDPVKRRLYSACRGSTSMEVLDADTGKHLASLPIGKGVDGAAFDPASGTAFSSNGEGSLTAITEPTPGSFTVAQTIPTRPGARTMTLDEKTGHLLLVTADRKPAPATATGEQRRPDVVPGTFSLLVVGR